MKKILIIPLSFAAFSLVFSVWAIVFQLSLKGFSVQERKIAKPPEYAHDIVRSPAAPTSTPASASVDQEVLMIAVGDIMLSRNVADKIRKYHDTGYPFASTSAFLKSADFVFGNLESPITAGPAVPTGSLTFHADPGVESALAAANFKVLSLANNHLPNYGDNGIADTIKYLDKAGIEHAGAGKNLAEAISPAFVEAKGIKFAFLAFNDNDVVPPSYGAADHRAGTALMDRARMQAAVSAAKQRADLVIVSMHSGREYTEELTDSQAAFAHAAIDAGAELVIGHHPHVTQRVEKYKGKYIFYSLGNFVFDQMWSEETRRGAAIKLYFSRTGLRRAEVRPVRIMDYSRPILADQKTAEAIYQRLLLGPEESEIKLLSAF